MRILNNNIKLKSALETMGKSVLALSASLFIAGLLIFYSGYSPLSIYAAIFAKSFSSIPNIALVISQSTPLLFSGLSFAIGLKAGLINTGVEGQLLAGAMIAALGGAYITILPGVSHLLFCLILGAVGGGLIAIFTTVLKVKTGASEVIMGIMLNNIIKLVTGYLANGPLRPAGSSMGQTKEILSSAVLPKIIPRTQMTSAIIIVIVLAIFLHIMLTKMTFGYKIRVSGQNKLAGSVAGINISKVYYKTAFIFGALSGLGGACLALGVYERFVEGISLGYGFAGIPVAALAAYNPLGVLFSGLLFGTLRAGTMTLSRTTNVPIEIVNLIQALVVVFVSAPGIILSIKNIKLSKLIKKVNLK